jgi:cysteinyl-tRNA synthetase
LITHAWVHHIFIKCKKLREKKEWQLADEIRARLNKLDIVVEDAKAGGGKYTR